MGSYHRQDNTGQIYVRADDPTHYYGDTKANWELDFNRTAPDLLPGYQEQLYVQETKNAYIGYGGTEGGPMPWTEGDDIISHLDDALAAKALRLG